MTLDVLEQRSCWIQLNYRECPRGDGGVIGNPRCLSLLITSLQLWKHIVQAEQIMHSGLVEPEANREERLLAYIFEVQVAL